MSAVRFECPCGKSQSSVRGFHTVRFSSGPELFCYCSLECLHARVSSMLDAAKTKQAPRHEFGEEGWDGDED